jgi:hypothetical protein
MNYEKWLESIKDLPKELVKFNIEIYGKTDFNENCDKETLDYLYNYLMKSERGKQVYIFKTTPLITHWSVSHNRIMRYSGALGHY